MTTIKVPRPEDPEIAAAWDEAKRIVEARDPDCCVGDRSQCRCAARQLARADKDHENWLAVWRDEVEP